MWIVAIFLAASPCRAASSLNLPNDKYKTEFVETIDHDYGFETVLRFPSPVKSPWPANNVVWAHLIVPKSLMPVIRSANVRWQGGRIPQFPAAPAILVLPVMAAPNIWIEDWFIRRFVRDGFIVMWLEMPTQFHRRPDPSEPSGQVFLSRTPRGLAANFRQSVLDARRALDVLSAEPRVDASRVAIFGISLGAIVSSIVYSIDSRLKFAVLLLGGADFPTLIVKSSLTGPIARTINIKPEEMRAAWAGIDPLDFRAANAGKPAVLVNASWDTVIPRENGLKLAEAFPASRQIWVPFGHYSSILHLLWLPGWASRQFAAALTVKKQ